MADEADEAAEGAAAAAGEAECPPPPKCEECVPGLPGWMATFSDLVTLLLTFFVLLLSFAKTETAKYEAALGSIRNAFGGNVLKMGEVLQPGKSPDDSPEMVDSEEPIRPFPIEFLTMEGLLDKHEVNRESTETLNEMKDDLREFALSENVDVYEMPEGIKVRVRDKIYFQESSLKIEKVSVAVLEKLSKLITEKKWTLFIEGHARRGERSKDKKLDAMGLSSKRAEVVARKFVQNGVKPDQLTIIFYGDSRPDEQSKREGVGLSKARQVNRRVEFMLRKTDYRSEGRKVQAQ